MLVKSSPGGAGCKPFVKHRWQVVPHDGVLTQSNERTRRARRRAGMSPWLPLAIGGEMPEVSLELLVGRPIETSSAVL